MSIDVTVELKVKDIASTIKKLKREDREELLLLLSEEGEEIKKRMKDIRTKKVKMLSRREILKDVL